MKKLLLTAALAVLGTVGANAQLLISQYFEGPSGTGNSKAIELWNTSGSIIDFSTSTLVLNIFVNGSNTPTAAFTITSGTLGAGQVLVLAHNEVAFNSTLTTAGITPFATSSALTFNGDDALSVVLGGITTDVFGTIGTDPGTAWTGGGVSTVDTNIELISGITTGSTGFSDPSTRFVTVVVPTNPLDGTDLAGLGIAPVPEPSTYALIGLGLGGLFVLRRMKKTGKA